MRTCLIAMVVAMLGLAGCASPQQYIMSTKTGGLIQTSSKPELNKDTGVYTYKNADGKEGMINKDDVVEIIER